jgi:hypothetical protein
MVTGWRYAPTVPDFTLDDLLRQLTEVLAEMASSQEMFLRQLQELQLTQREAAAASEPRSRPLVDPAEPVLMNGAIAPERSEGGYAITARTTTSAAPTETPWPIDSNQPRHPPSSANRDYDYFAELDQKLDGLRRRYIE